MTLLAHRALRLGCALALVACAWEAHAQEASAQQSVPADVDLATALRLVRDESPIARALRAQVAITDADAELAGVYPNPELGYVAMGRFDGSNQAINGSQHQVWIDVPLLIAGQHGARRDVAAALAVAARAELDVDLLALEVAARRAFNALLVAQARVVRLESARAQLESLRSIAEQRAGAGAQSRYDVARIALEATRIDADVAVARADQHRAAADLASLAGRPGWLPRARGALEPGDRQLETAAAELPSVRAARLRAEAAERDVRRAELERIPEIRVGIGSYVTSDPDSASVYGGLSIPLPIFDTGEAAVARARAARDAAAEARDAVQARAEAVLEGAIAVLRARLDALRSFDAATMSRIPELRDMSEAAYRLGVSGMFELLDGFRATLELELARIDLLASAADAEVDVRATLGRIE